MNTDRHGSLDAAYFAAKYAHSTDPWALADSWYERRKYLCTVALLPRQTYRACFEPGCSIGLLSRELAGRCDRLLCWDIDDRAVRTTAARLAGDHTVTVETGAVPTQWPSGTFDLIVLSELVYYLGKQDRRALQAAAAASLEPGGHLAAVHWRPASPEHCCHGDTVHAELRADPRFRPLAGYTEREFLIDLHERKAR